MSKSFIGIDVHKRTCVYTEINSNGKVVRQGKFSNNLKEICNFASSLTGHENIVLEPVLNYLWLLDELEPFAKSVHVASPYKVRVIAESKCKTDRYDSRILAELLRTNFLPESWIPPKEIRALRDIIHQRHRLVKTVVMHKNYIRNLLFSHGVDLKVANIASAKAIREIKRLQLPDRIRLAINQCLKIINGIVGMIKDFDSEIKKHCDTVGPVDLLRTIPGIGPLWAATIYAEIGDINRFPNGKSLASYTGLVPTVRSSGETAYYGSITYQGSRLLRNALVEAAIRTAQRSSSMRRMYHRIVYRKNSQKARVAVARKLSVIIYKMLKNNEPFRCE